MAEMVSPEEEKAEQVKAPQLAHLARVPTHFTRAAVEAEATIMEVQVVRADPEAAEPEKRNLLAELLAQLLPEPRTPVLAAALGVGIILAPEAPAS